MVKFGKNEMKPTERTCGLFSLGWNSSTYMDCVFLWVTLVWKLQKGCNNHPKDGKKTMRDESDFLKLNPNAQRFPDCDSATARAYMTAGYLWLFDKQDGHLAWKYERKTHQTIYECECIKRGRAILGRR